jgi:hypothetical protein
MREELLTPDAIPFNLAGEHLDNTPTAEGIARARAEAESEQRKAQRPLFGDSQPRAKTYDEKLHEPYVGRFPRGAHSHKCDECGHRVACYKSRCTKGSRVSRCGWCGGRP